MLPRRPRLVVFLAVLHVGVAGVAPAAQAAETMGVAAPVTDNYKAKWNADPSVRETRTWLSFDSISASGTTWKPAPPSNIVVSSGPVTVYGADGRQGTLSARVAQGAATTSLRYDHPARGAKVGPLVQLAAPDSIAQTPVRVDLALVVGGATIASGAAYYRDEPAFDGLPGDHVEYNGPGGRWYLGGTAIRTDWEPASSGPASATATVAPAPVTVRPPRITRMFLAARVSRPVVAVAVRGTAVGSARIAFARFQIGNRSWTGWTRIRPTYALRLPRVNGSVRIRAQLRNAAGQNSGVVQRWVRCGCR